MARPRVWRRSPLRSPPRSRTGWVPAALARSPSVAHAAALPQAARDPDRAMLRRPMTESRFPCPACGHLVFDEAPGSDDICLVCLWEDDLTQLRWPALAGGKNEVSLIEAQKNIAQLGAIEERFAGDVRPATP